jgi:hypothetical protein
VNIVNIQLKKARSADIHGVRKVDDPPEEIAT